VSRWGTELPVSSLVGLTMIAVIGKVGDDVLTFATDDGRRFRFEHYQECCESVYVEDICGDLEDLVGSPIVTAEAVSNEPQPEAPDYADSDTQWTFYKFATLKGSVTVRWFGSSNGYYSTGVSFAEVSP
jgi:hypothetical protein